MDDREGESPVKSIRKAVDVLDVLAGARRPLRISEISARLGMSASAVSRIVTTLSKVELIHQDEESGRCHLGFGLAVLGAKSLGRRNLDRIAMPIMDEIAARAGHYVGLGRLSRGRVVIMRALPCPLAQNEITLTVVAPIHACAPGKILAGSMPKATVSDLLAKYGMDPITAHTITEPERFFDAIEDARRNGFAVDQEEGAHNYAHFAVPIMDHNGEVVASLSSGGPLAEVGAHDVPTLLQELSHGALRISRELDYRGEMPLDLGALDKEAMFSAS